MYVSLMYDATARQVSVGPTVAQLQASDPELCYTLSELDRIYFLC